MGRLRHSRLAFAILGAVVAVAVAVPTALALFGGKGSEKPAPAAKRNANAGHNMAAMGGAHPVAGNFEANDVELADCDGADNACLEQAFGNLAYEDGPKDALSEFDRRMQTDPDVERDCHRIVHTIGSAALARFDGNIAEAFAAGSASCWSGYYHGILERAFTGVASRDDAGEAARGMCDDSEIKANTFLFYQCVHGLGHGLMIYSGLDLPWALSTCDQLTTKWEQSSCTGGVFMENISTSYGVKSRWVKEDDPVYPCPTVKERHKLYCYLMVTSRINELNGFDWKETATTCRRVERNWVGTCFESYGRDASGNTRQNPPEIKRLCGFAKAYEVSCIYGAARDITSNDAGGRRAARLCAIVAAPFRAQCFYGIGTILGGLAADEGGRRAKCTEVTPRLYLKSCLGGAGVRVSGIVESTKS